MSPLCHLDLENNKLLHNTPAHNDHNNTKFGNKMFSGLKDVIRTHAHNLTLHCDLDLESSNPVCLFFPQDTPAYDAVLSNQVWWQMDQQFSRYSRNSHIVILTLKIVNQFFCLTLHLILSHLTKVG